MQDEQSNGLTYRDAGVDIDAGEEMIRSIKPLVRETTEWFYLYRFVR